MKSMLVIGLGRFGQHLASNLLDLDNDVMIIDSDEKKLEGLVPYATSSKIGDCTNEEVLHSLGVAQVEEGLGALDQLEKVSGRPAPVPLASLRDKAVRFTESVDKGQMMDVVLEMLR